MRSPRFYVQVLDGLTDGKPSWRAHDHKRFHDKDRAREVKAELEAKFPLRRFRILKVR